MSVKKILFIVLGFLSLLLGVVGIFLPVLPTTPLVLFAAFCFAKSNQRLEAWLLRNRLFGPFIENYRTKKGISVRHKVGTLVFLWVGLIISMLVVKNGWIILLLFAIGAGVSTHVLMLKHF